MADENEEEDSEKILKSFSKPMVKKPQIIHYDSFPEAIPSKDSDSAEEIISEDIPIPGFGEFRKYKAVNEARVITPYKPEPIMKKKIKPEVKVYPAVEIENVDRFLLEKIKSIPVESLESLLKMVHIYPDVGFVTMNRPHMNLLDDYQPYSYAICNYNDKDETNYSTISPNGLMEVYKGEADFMPLDRLLEEYELYCTLKEIPLFSYFLYWKAFMVWFKKIRRRKFVDASNKLEIFFAEKFKTSKKYIKEDKQT